MRAPAVTAYTTATPFELVASFYYPEGARSRDVHVELSSLLRESGIGTLARRVSGHRPPVAAAYLREESSSEVAVWSYGEEPSCALAVDVDSKTGAVTVAFTDLPVQREGRVEVASGTFTWVPKPTE